MNERLLIGKMVENVFLARNDDQKPVDIIIVFTDGTLFEVEVDGPALKLKTIGKGTRS